jgi:hypothetical protein
VGLEWGVQLVGTQRLLGQGMGLADSTAGWLVRQVHGSELVPFPHQEMRLTAVAASNRSKQDPGDILHFGREAAVVEEVLGERLVGLGEVVVGASGAVVEDHVVVVDLLVGEAQGLVRPVRPVPLGRPLFLQTSYWAHGRWREAAPKVRLRIVEGHRFLKGVGFLLEPRVRDEGVRSPRHT